MLKSVGVVIPTFERPKQTIRAVHSALNQTFKPTRIIVVDDGSAEATRSLLQTAMIELGVEYLQLEHSGHPGMARKKGVIL